jgi:predicted RNase H-like HicB family nuclease
MRKRQFTAILKRTPKWFIAFCPEVPGANGQGKTKRECLEDLAAAIALMLKVYREETLADIGKPTEETLVTVG